MEGLDQLLHGHGKPSTNTTTNPSHSQDTDLQTHPLHRGSNKLSNLSTKYQSQADQTTFYTFFIITLRFYKFHFIHTYSNLHFQETLSNYNLQQFTTIYK